MRPGGAFFGAEREVLFIMQPTMFPLMIINRTTVMRILDTMEFRTDANLFNFRVVQCGTDTRKQFCLERKQPA